MEWDSERILLPTELEEKFVSWAKNYVKEDFDNLVQNGELIVEACAKKITLHASDHQNFPTATNNFVHIEKSTGTVLLPTDYIDESFIVWPKKYLDGSFDKLVEEKQSIAQACKAKIESRSAVARTLSWERATHRLLKKGKSIAKTSLTRINPKVQATQEFTLHQEQKSESLWVREPSTKQSSKTINSKSSVFQQENLDMAMPSLEVASRAHREQIFKDSQSEDADTEMASEQVNSGLSKKRTLDEYLFSDAHAQRLWDTCQERYGYTIREFWNG